MAEVEIRMSEWDWAPKPDSHLADYVFESEDQRRQAAQLHASRVLEILELRRGIEIRSNSYVGTVRLGPLRIIVQPKIPGFPLRSLLRYAYGLRDLKVYEDLDLSARSEAFQDLLIQQLASETEELIDRGLHREYLRRQDALSSPRGRIDFHRFARQTGLVEAALPCVHHPRLEDCLLNGVLLGGLRLAERLTEDLSLRVRLRRSAALIETRVAPVVPNGSAFACLGRQMDRRMAHYQPALTLIQLLASAIGSDLEASQTSITVPGFLFDMNRFFQALLSRFLHEHLLGYEVRDEQRLRGMLAYDGRHNPRQRRAPEPRPDFVIRRQEHTVNILDAKYRDLWAEPLPREMLYQVGLYALSHQAGGTAAILYPTLHAEAIEAQIEIRDPLLGERLATVILRPVHLLKMADLVSQPVGMRRDRECAAYSEALVLP